MLVAVLVFYNSSEPGAINYQVTWWTLPNGTEIGENETLKAESEEGNFANLGFSNDSLVFNVRYQEPIEKENAQFLIIRPSYLDRVEMVHYSKTGQLPISQQIKGDHIEAEKASAYQHDIEQLVFELPAGAESSRIIVSSTSNLRATVNFVNEKEMLNSFNKSLIVKSAIITIIVLFAFLSMVIGYITKDTVLWLFSLYQFVWAVFLLSIANIFSLLDVSLLLLNGELVSIGAISASLTGALFHAQFMQSICQSRWFYRLLYAGAFVLAIILCLYGLGYNRLALHTNILVISIIPFILMIGVFVVKANSHINKLILNKIKPLYFLLMFVVVLTGISGLGVGDQLSLTFMHALLTGVLLSYILIIRLNIQLRFRAKKQLIGRASLVSTKMLKAELQDQITLMSILTHEIKTPLTTIKLKLYHSPQRSEVRPHLNAIEHVLDEVNTLGVLDREKELKVKIDAVQILQSIWRRVSSQSRLLVEFNYNYRGNMEIKVEQFIIETIMENLMENALKYADEDSQIKASIFRNGDKIIFRLSNQCSAIEYKDMSSIYEKYWRGKSQKRVHGTGLGLWIVQQLCQSKGYQYKAELKGNRFVFTLCVTDE